MVHFTGRFTNHGHPSLFFFFIDKHNILLSNFMLRKIHFTLLLLTLEWNATYTMTYIFNKVKILSRAPLIGFCWYYNFEVSYQNFKLIVIFLTFKMLITCFKINISTKTDKNRDDTRGFGVQCRPLLNSVFEIWVLKFI